MIVALDSDVIGVISISDPPKPEARGVVAALEHQGIASCIVTGKNLSNLKRHRAYYWGFSAVRGQLANSSGHCIEDRYQGRHGRSFTCLESKQGSIPVTQR